VADRKHNSKGIKKPYELYVDSTYIDYMFSAIEKDRNNQMRDYNANFSRLSEDFNNFKRATAQSNSSVHSI
jgi:hypothetical protein